MEQLFESYGLTEQTGLDRHEALGTIPIAHDVESRQLLALGLGERVTPLELLEAYRRLAEQLQSGKDESARLVSSALRETVERGMARSARSQKMRIAGKTGTAVDRGESVGWFVGWTPAEAPTRVIVVRLLGTRGQDAAALARDLLESVR
ncbi:MAG: hypothetical protein NVS9B15_05600 [Acidobacteriaceae bacterium]